MKGKRDLTALVIVGVAILLGVVGLIGIDMATSALGGSLDLTGATVGLAVGIPSAFAALLVYLKAGG